MLKKQQPDLSRRETPFRCQGGFEGPPYCFSPLIVSRLEGEVPVSFYGKCSVTVAVGTLRVW